MTCSKERRIDNHGFEFGPSRRGNGKVSLGVIGKACNHSKVLNDYNQEPVGDEETGKGRECQEVVS